MQWIHEGLGNPITVLWFQVSVIMVIGFLTAGWLSRYVNNVLEGKLVPQSQMLAKKVTYYAILFLFLINAFNQLGFSIHVILGSAGVFAVAVGFAARTSISNIISGLFLLVEQPFVVGDRVKIKNYIGDVLSIDMMSTKLRTCDNTLLRLPNETLLKSELINLSSYDVRSCELTVHLKTQQFHLEEAISKLHDIISNIEYHDTRYTPEVIVDQMNDSDTVLKCTLWVRSADITEMQNAFYTAIRHWLKSKD